MDTDTIETVLNHQFYYDVDNSNGMNGLVSATLNTLTEVQSNQTTTRVSVLKAS